MYNNDSWENCFTISDFMLEEIKLTLDKFRNDQKYNHYGRFASFDYCYNYFHNFYINKNIKDIAKKENIETSNLQLGFYLASWGMYRGSTHVLQKSVKYLENVIIYI